MKTAELIGPALDWAVAKCEDSEMAQTMADVGCIFEGYNTSTNWSQGGPIVDREKYDLSWLPKMQQWCAQRKQHGTDGFVTHIGFGPTLLIAAMRCFVTSNLGDEIEIPKELTKSAE